MTRRALNQPFLFSINSMAKVDGADSSFYMNPAAYSQVKDDKKTKTLRRGEKTEFSRMFDDLRGKTADQLGPLQNYSASAEVLNALMDDVRDAGDTLKDRPLPDEIMRYKQAVRSFINYVVQNTYSLDHEKGLPKYLKPGFSGERGTDESKEQKRHTVIRVIDKKLEELASMLLTSHAHQMQLVSRLEEIRGLLIDLLQ